MVYRLLYLADGVGLSLMMTFFLKGILEDKQSLALLGFCIFASRIIWPREGRHFLFTLVGFLLGILVGLVVTDLHFNWSFYFYFILAGFGERFYQYTVMKKRKMIQ